MLLILVRPYTEGDTYLMVFNLKMVMLKRMEIEKFDYRVVGDVDNDGTNFTDSVLDVYGI